MCFEVSILSVALTRKKRRVIGVFGFRDESGVVDEVSRDQIWGSDEREPCFGDAVYHHFLREIGCHCFVTLFLLVSCSWNGKGVISLQLESK